MTEQIAKSLTVESFIGRLEGENTPRVPGTAVFFTRHLEQAPPSLQQLLIATGAVHEQVILVTVIIEPVPRIEGDERMVLTTLDGGFHHLVLHYGFMQGPNIPSDLSVCAANCGLELDHSKLNYFVGHVELLAGRKIRGMAEWRDRLLCLTPRYISPGRAG